jgi:UDP-N-acetylmuramoyl-tripeptide--D-alanyl-D-alanine ligase
MTDPSAAGALFSLDEILSDTRGTLLFPAARETEIASVAIDSRAVQPGALFVALAGERADGHQHLGQAMERGARALLVEEGKARAMGDSLREQAASAGTAVVAVADTLAGLQDLARRHMRRLPPITRIAVTGSNGKTTTKEIIGGILSVGSAVAVNEGNLNSEIGLPVACFAVQPAHRYAVFEMGMNRRGEMDILTDIVRPDLALITNVGTAHIGLLGSKQHIAEEKKRIFARFSGSQTGFLNDEEPFSAFLAEGVKGRIVFFGPRSTRGYRGSESQGLDGTLIHWEGFRIRFPLFGPYNVSNALGAISVAQELGVPPAEVRDGLEAVRPLFGRSQIIRGPVTVVFDCYNANPDSMDQALSFLEQLPWPGRKLAVLGGMRELGEEGAEAHRTLGRRLAFSTLDAILLFADEMADAWGELSSGPRGDSCFWTADFNTLTARVRGLLHEGDILLIKGSRGLELERLLPELSAAERREASCS